MKTRPQSKRPEILRAAAKLFLANGYRASSIEKIASEVGILKGSVYYHIRSKEGLLAEVIIHAVHCAERSLLKGAAIIEDAQSVQKRLESHFEYICGNYVGLAALLREAEQLPRDFWGGIRREVENYERLLARTLRIGQRYGVVAAGDATVLAQVMIGAATWWCWIDREPAQQALVK